MLQLKSFDPSHPIDQQLGVAQSPVVLINTFVVDAADAEALLKAWQTDANWMKRQPGFISTQLHKAVGGNAMFLNYAVWESVGHFREAFTHPEFRASLAAYPDSAVASPHLFERLTMPNLCVA
ncbi:MAG: antibiotic biosynthesis monooxygenase family protein [Hyphomicrobiaceae bacterium]|nr:antibiotic biosynthesis monooxygenase [Hyphomicrobium sp.]